MVRGSSYLQPPKLIKFYKHIPYITKIQREKQDNTSKSQNLHNAVIFVIDQTVGAQSMSHTVQTEQIAFAFIGIAMNGAGDEVTSSQQWL